MSFMSVHIDEYQKMIDRNEELKSINWELSFAISYLYSIVRQSESFKDLDSDLEMRKVVLDEADMNVLTNALELIKKEIK